MGRPGGGGGGHPRNAMQPPLLSCLLQPSKNGTNPFLGLHRADEKSSGLLRTRVKEAGAVKERPPIFR